ncbi:MAG TPA: hypothetical protein VN764_09925 [Polyangiaceae bacterium]|nr:hypothetical protein [Polyangiaceae bacterium]
MNKQGQPDSDLVSLDAPARRGRAIITRWLLVGGALGLCLPVACKDPPPQDEQAKAVTDPAQLEKLKKQAQAAQAAAATQAKRSAENARQRREAAELKSAQDKMLVCCEAIAKRGFEGRSMDYMNAFELCDGAHKKGQDFSSVAEAVRATLHGATLPEECGK